MVAQSTMQCSYVQFVERHGLRSSVPSLRIVWQKLEQCPVHQHTLGDAIRIFDQWREVSSITQAVMDGTEIFLM
jgi:hypothetical protein